jgi:hypothetical protein
MVRETSNALHALEHFIKFWVENLGGKFHLEEVGVGEGGLKFNM